MIHLASKGILKLTFRLDAKTQLSAFEIRTRIIWGHSYKRVQGQSCGAAVLCVQWQFCGTFQFCEFADAVFCNRQ